MSLPIELQEFGFYRENAAQTVSFWIDEARERSPKGAADSSSGTSRVINMEIP